MPISLKRSQQVGDIDGTQFEILYPSLRVVDLEQVQGESVRSKPPKECATSIWHEDVELGGREPLLLDDRFSFLTLQFTLPKLYTLWC